MRAVALYLLAGAALVTTLPSAHAASINVYCDNGNPTQIGQIDVNPSGQGISGSFTSFIGSPASLSAAAASCGEDHFNWYQIVTADNQAPPGLTPPYVDVPPGGYPIAFDNTWADNLPWYFDEECCGIPVNPPGRVVNNNLLLGTNTHFDTLDFGDFPNGGAGLQLSFMTWLVSLNADGSLHSFHSGFSWNFTQGTGVTNVQQLGTDPFTFPVYPSQAQYADIIGGFQTSCPEPFTWLLTAAGSAMLVVLRRRRP